MLSSASIKKLVNKSVYDKKKKEFSITFKEMAVAKLVQLMMGSKAQRSKLGKTVRFSAEDADAQELLTLLEVTTTIK